MDDIIGLIWAAIIIGWAIKTVANQNKRKTVREPHTDTTEGSERVALPKERRVGTVPAHPVAAARRMKSPAETSYGPADRKATIRPLPNPSERNPAPHEAPFAAFQEQSAGANRSEEPFDLRRAVIYAEILKPKFEE